MRENFAQMQGWIGLSEGGYVNHPKDPGGKTNRGITQRTFDAWRRSRREDVADVRSISKAEAEAIIEQQYFLAVRADLLPAGLDYAVADYAVNSGPSRAAKDLQRALGFSGGAVDGHIGAQTLAAVRSVKSLPELIVQLCERRMSFLRRLPTWGDFGKGWTRRVLGDLDGVQTEDIGVVDRAVRMARGAPKIPAPVKAEPGKSYEPAGLFAALLAAVLKAFRKGPTQ